MTSCCSRLSVISALYSTECYPALFCILPCTALKCITLHCTALCSILTRYSSILQGLSSSLLQCKRCRLCHIHWFCTCHGIWSGHKTQVVQYNANLTGGKCSGVSLKTPTSDDTTCTTHFPEPFVPYLSEPAIKLKIVKLDVVLKGV